MSLKTRRMAFYLFWFLIILSGPYTVLKNITLNEALSDKFLFINFLQRILGLIAFTLLFAQVVIGATMNKLVQIIGGKAYKFHITQGIVVYLFIIVHPLMQTLLDFYSRGLFAALISFLPGKDIYLNLGKLGFFGVTIAVIAGYFRTKPFFRRNWNKLHVLNYIVFYIIAAHSWFLGTDVKTSPFIFVYWISILSVTYILAQKHLFRLVKKPASAANSLAKK